ncbi:metal ABC transporter substrate-binding protein [Nocardiopsis coralliicola]
MPKTVRRHGLNAWHAGCALAAAALAAATGCTAPPPPADDGRPLVVTTFTVLADMIDTVGSGHVAVESITRPGAEIHGYEPTPHDLVRTRGADLLVSNGLGLEGWFTRFTDEFDAPHAVLTEGIDTIAITSGTYQGQANPHAWMSPEAAQTYAANIAGALTRLDPGHAGDYARAAEDYSAEIAAVGDELRAAVESAPPAARTLVTCEGAFSYLARDVGLDERYLWPVNAESEGTPRQIAEVVRGVRAAGVPAVFCETTVNDKPMQRVAEETGARYAGSLYVDSLSAADGPVPTYLDLLRHDADTIARGLAAGSAGGSAALTPADEEER